MLALVITVSLLPLTAALANQSEALVPQQQVRAADALHTLGLFRGVGVNADGSPDFALGRAPTRAEAVTMFVRLLGASDEAHGRQWETPFTDVPDWAEPYVGYAYNNALTFGVSNTAFGSQDTATAAMYLTFVLRALGYVSGDDFEWDSAWTLTDELGITNRQFSAQNNAITRGGVAHVSLAALLAEHSVTGSLLIDDLIAAGVVPENAREIVEEALVTHPWWDVQNFPVSDFVPSARGDAENPHSPAARFAGQREITGTVNGDTLTLTHYWGWYYENPSFWHQAVNIFVPETADENTPIFAFVDGGGWQSNDFPVSSDQGNAVRFVDDGFDLAAYGDRGRPFYQALERGMIVVTAGARGRNNARDADGNFTGKSPVNVVDWKAVIRFVNYNIENGGLPGNSDRIIAMGYSGGGGIVAQLGATGNHPDYFPFLYEAGALGVTRIGGTYNGSGSSDAIFAPLAGAPMIYAGGGDFPHEWDYFPWRALAWNDGNWDDADAPLGWPNRAATAQRAVHLWEAWEMQLSEALHNFFPTYATSYDAINSVTEVEAVVVEMAERAMERFLAGVAQDGSQGEPQTEDALRIALRNHAPLVSEDNQALWGVEADHFRVNAPMDWFTVDANRNVTITSFRDYTEFQFLTAQFIKKIAMGHDGGILYAGAGQDGGIGAVGTPPTTGSRVGSMFGRPDEITAPVTPFSYAMVVHRWGVWAADGWTYEGGWAYDIVDWSTWQSDWVAMMQMPWTHESVTEEYRDWVRTQRAKMFEYDGNGNLALIQAAHGAWAANPNSRLYALQARLVNPLPFLLNAADSARADIAPHWFVSTGLMDDGAAWSEYAMLEIGLRTNPQVQSHDHQLIVGWNHTGILFFASAEVFEWLDGVLGLD